MLIRKIKPDNYLKKFIEYCREKFGDNLVAVVVFGSYAWGYFDKKKSDYDLFVILRGKIIDQENVRKKPYLNLTYLPSSQAKQQ